MLQTCLSRGEVTNEHTRMRKTGARTPFYRARIIDVPHMDSILADLNVKRFFEHRKTLKSRAIHSPMRPEQRSGSPLVQQTVQVVAR
ncbi:hypothetical protein SDC9_212599 [bioreactor metagenome]|uniref:Uncharacterized protein n=1 Tax=bioreactor metagenome TaxID=1076179 RepID=A0A645JNG0_9ZZZZ